MMFDFPEDEAYQGLGLAALFLAWREKMRISSYTFEKLK